MLCRQAWRRPSLPRDGIVGPWPARVEDVFAAAVDAVLTPVTTTASVITDALEMHASDLLIAPVCAAKGWRPSEWGSEVSDCDLEGS